MWPTHRVKFNFKELNLIPPLCSLSPTSGGGGSASLHHAHPQDLPKAGGHPSLRQVTPLHARPPLAELPSSVTSAHLSLRASSSATWLVPVFLTQTIPKPPWGCSGAPPTDLHVTRGRSMVLPQH